MPNTKQEFVKIVLQDEGRRLIHNQGVEMEKRLHFHTRRVFNNRSASVSQSNSDGVLSIKHTAVERFLDIKRKSRNKNTNRLRTRSLRIHNKFIFGHYFSISRRLMYEYTEDARQQILTNFNSLTNG